MKPPYLSMTSLLTLTMTGFAMGQSFSVLALENEHKTHLTTETIIVLANAYRKRGDWFRQMPHFNHDSTVIYYDRALTLRMAIQLLYCLLGPVWLWCVGVTGLLVSRTVLARPICLLLCLFWGLPSVSHAQNKRDSFLYALLKTAKTPPRNWIEKTALWDKIADAYVSVDKLDSAALLLEQNQVAFEKAGDKKRQATNLNRLGVIANRRLQLDKAMQYNFKALAIWETLSDKLGIAQSYCNLTFDFYYNTNGTAYGPDDRFRTAARYGEKAIAAALETKDSTLLAEAYRRTAASYLALGNFGKALKIINISIAIREELLTQPEGMWGSLNVKGNVLKYLKRYDEALATYQRALNSAEKLHIQRGISVCNANIGQVLLLQNQPAQALPHLLKANEVAEAIHDRTNLSETYGQTSEVYERLGNYAESLNYFKKCRNLQDSIYTLERDKTTAELQTRYETGKKETLISVQNQQLSQQRKVQWLMGGFALLLLGFLSFLYRSYQIRTKNNRLLAEANEQLRARNAENELLLKEIHHRVKNNLEVISSLLELQSGYIDDPDVQQAMLASQNRVQSMGILHQKLYQSEHLAFIEMKQYFQNLSENILDAYNASSRVTIDCPMTELELDVDTAVPVGLIVNELLSNALKYAFPKGQTGRVQLTLEAIGNDMLRLCIADNGIGKSLNGKAQGSGFGTQLVELLTRQLEGTLFQEVDNGTTISVQFKRVRVA